MDKVNLQNLLDIIEEVVDLSRIAIDIDSVLGEDIPVDSADMLRIISRIESQYELKFKTHEILNFNTIGDLVQAVNRNMHTG